MSVLNDSATSQRSILSSRRSPEGASSRPVLWPLAVLAVAAILVASPASAQSRGGSRTGSALLGGGSELVVAGSVEMLHGGAELVVTSVETTAEGVRLVLSPVAHAASQSLEVSAEVVVEVSLEAWEAALSARRAAASGLELSAIVAGELVEAVALHGAVAGAGGTSVLGLALVIGDVVLGIVAHDELQSLVGHAVHHCVRTSR